MPVKTQKKTTSLHSRGGHSNDKQPVETMQQQKRSHHRKRKGRMKGDVFYRYDLKRQIKKHARDGLIVEDIPRATLTMTNAKQRAARNKEKEKRAGTTNMWCLIVV